MQTYFGSKAVAHRLGISRGTVLNMTRDGRLRPAGKLDGPLGPYIYAPAEVERAAALAIYRAAERAAEVAR